MTEDSKKLELKLAELLREFLREMKAESAIDRITLQADFEADLGIDSLGRIEFLHRVERAFDTKFPTSVFAKTHTLADVVSLLSRTIAEEDISKKKIMMQAPPSEVILHAKSETIVDRLRQYVEKDPDRIHIYYLDEEGHEIPLSYKDIYTAASETAAGLISRGLIRYQTVAIMLPTGEDFFAAFLGILLAGGIPVPIYPPFRLDRIEDYVRREAKTLDNAQASFLITFSRAQTLSQLIKGFIPSLHQVVTVDALRKSGEKSLKFRPSSTDPAFIQYTSGSTGDPKGVLLNHGNLMANISSIGEALKVTPEDRVVSWLPLYHDMGLIGCWFGSLYFGLPLTIMSPLSFISRPAKWLWAVDSHQATITCAPNFAYEICAKKIKDDEIEGLDLSSLRITANGAEMVHPDTIRKFIKRFSAYGLKPSALFPVYGLAENTVALAFPPLDRKEPRIDTVDRKELETKGIARKSDKSGPEVIEFVACGEPIPKHEIKIADDDGNEVPERVIGKLWFKGPSKMQGYFNNPTETKRITHGDWLDSSDYAYMAEGDIFITGRVKDMIIKTGRNIYPQDIEEITSRIPGIRKGCVAAIGIVDKLQGTEKIVVIAETMEKDPKKREIMKGQITTSIFADLGLPPDEIILVPPHTVPKTSSGKLQRSACKELYLSGMLTKRFAPFWLQMVKVTGKSLLSRSQNYLTKVIDFLYTIYVGFIALILFFPIILTTFALPQKQAQMFVKMWTRLLFLLSGHPLRVENKQALFKEKPVIYVANHTSYTDSFILLAILPPDTAFVGKAEIFNFKPFKWFLSKLGHLIVERGDIIQGLADIEVMAKHLHSGKSLMIYPEGTFTHIPGLRSFKSGAFKLAIDNQVPVVAIALRGTRKLLSDLAFLLHPTKIEIIVSDPLKPEGEEWSDVVELKCRAREKIAQHCGESPLGGY